MLHGYVYLRLAHYGTNQISRILQFLCNITTFSWLWITAPLFNSCVTNNWYPGQLGSRDCKKERKEKEFHIQQIAASGPGIIHPALEHLTSL